jgi:hypothetical protein
MSSAKLRDLLFDLGVPERYRTDAPNADAPVLHAEHFALDTRADEIATLIRQFTGAQSGRQCNRSTSEGA